MAQAIDIASWALLLSGVAFCLTGGIGLLRMPDLFTRMHGGGMPDTLGAGLILSGLMLQAGFSLLTLKLALILLLMLISCPTSTHALARAAISHGVRPMEFGDDGKDSSSTT